MVGNINYSSLSIVPGAVHEGNSHLFSEAERDDMLARIQGELGNRLAGGESSAGDLPPKEDAPPKSLPLPERVVVDADVEDEDGPGLSVAQEKAS